MNLRQVGLAAVCAALIALSLGSRTANARAHSLNEPEAVRFRTGLRNAPGKRQLSASQLQQVLQNLREKTGWRTLAFDEAGFLVCAEPQTFSGGSEAARRLLGAALAGAAVYELEAHSLMQSVSFARLGIGANYESHRTRAKVSVYPVQIDFADFYQLRGPKQSLRAFDVGIVILHELAHGVWRLRDAAETEPQPGACENFINQIRRELHLPERQTYQAATYASSRSNARLIAELRFVRTVEKQAQARTKHYRLQWDAEAVGPLAGFEQGAKAGLAAAWR